MAGAPAWYRDPKNGARLRRWDGSAWTSDTRPLPGWAVPGVADSVTSTVTRLRHRATVLWAAGAGCAISALALIPFLARSDGPRAPRVSPAFVQRANQVCGRAPAGGPVVTPAAPPDDQSEAARITELVVRVDAMVDELRTLEVDRADEADVQRWLDDWGRYLAAGERLVVALQRGDRAAAARADAQSKEPKRALDRFSAANGLTRCIL